jgi:hypothetical protein
VEVWKGPLSWTRRCRRIGSCNGLLLVSGAGVHADEIGAGHVEGLTVVSFDLTRKAVDFVVLCCAVLCCAVLPFVLAVLAGWSDEHVGQLGWNDGTRR